MVILAVAGALAGVALAGAAASAAGTARLRARYEAEKGELLRRGRAAAAPALDPVATARLPAPVRRYVERAREAGLRPARLAVLRQRGTLRLAPGGRWLPFEAEQAYAAAPPGFVWLARARLLPLVHVSARDRFVDGEGRMLVRLLGALTVADARGPELDLGAALRYWGEVLAFAERALDPHVRWEGLDERRARLLVRQGALDLAAEVEFGQDGPLAFRARRFRDVDGEAVLTPWSGRFGAWRALGGRPFPTRWESVWHLPEGDFPAVRMEILALETE